MAGASLPNLLAGMPAERAPTMGLWQRALDGEEFTVVMELGCGEEDPPCYEIRFNPLWNRGGETIGAYQYAFDVTERVRSQARLAEAEEALRQSQKLKAMGQLKGGLAHDFNILLTPIVGSLDLLKRRELGGERERRMIDSALQAVERARALVQQLLAFARRQPLQPQPVDVGGLVVSMSGLIVSTFGPRIRVKIDVADGLPPAHVDANQIEMAILNLAVNARDAMPGGVRDDRRQARKADAGTAR